MKEDTGTFLFSFTSMNVLLSVEIETDMTTDLSKVIGCKNFLQPSVPSGLLRGTHVSWWLGTNLLAL